MRAPVTRLRVREDASPGAFEADPAEGEVIVGAG